ncbi:MAG: PAS domain-containing protein [Verrucomicrobia bacterium]|nr:PAS domain-containing protein [Verrucomicrobiota bacterium]
MNYLKSKVLPERGSTSALFNHGWALALFCLMIAVELITKATISPLVSMLCFGFFAHRMRPEPVAAWVVIFSLASLFFLLEPWEGGTPSDRPTAYIRFWTVMVGGIGAVILSFDRTRIAEGFLQTIRILEKLPAPVIISDNIGCVVFMNHDALKLLDTTADAVRGASYFSFVAGEERGKTIQKYLDFVDSSETILHDVILQIKKPQPMKTQAALVVIEGERTKLVATVFSPTRHFSAPEKVEPPAAAH